MLLHSSHAGKTLSKQLIKTVDSDVVSIAVGLFHELVGVRELWIEYGTGKTLKYLPIHEIANGLGAINSRDIPFFHSISGCDTTYAVAGKGKASFYRTWSMLPEVTETFIKLGNVKDVKDISEQDIRWIEKFFVTLYSATLNTEEVNVARRMLFTQGSRALENIPPTLSFLQKHILRASLQATYWSNGLVKQRPHLDPLEWGWRKLGDSVVPFWSDLPDASTACRELIKCGCRKTCRGRCKCKQNDLSCTELCSCSGQCTAVIYGSSFLWNV